MFLGLIDRPATDKDVPRLAQLHRCCFGCEAWSEAEIASSLALPTTQSFLVEDESGGVRAFCLVQNTGEETEILTICTDPSQRRLGLARHLLGAVLAKQKAETPVFLEVAADNGAAISLYKSSGFSVFGVRPGYYTRGTDRIDALTFRRD